ncbi:putative glycoside hydrolase [Spirochaetota bacterium]
MGKIAGRTAYLLFFLSLIHSAAPSLRITSTRELYMNREKQDFFIYKFKYIENIFFLSTFRNGIYRIDKKISRLNAQYPVNPVSEKPREIINFSPYTKDALLFITKVHLYTLSGNSAAELPLKGVRGGSRFSSVVYYKSNIYLGSTYNGVYKKTGDVFDPHSTGLPREKYAYKEYFYDEIRDFFIYNDTLFCVTDHTKGIYFLDKKGERWYPCPGVPETEYCLTYKKTVYICSQDNVFILTIDENNNYICKKTDIEKESDMLFETDDGEIESMGTSKPYFPYKNKKTDINKKTASVNGIFINLDYIKNSDIEVVEKLFKEKKINGVVINFKDDTGNLIYGSKLKIAKESGASMLHHRLISFLDTIKPYDPYIIARCVVFKDMRMHKYRDSKYALWDKHANKPWQVNKIEYWVDPYSEFIVDYNVSVAKEIESMKDTYGVNEVQFDYIRLPSDKAKSRVTYRFKKKGWERIDILDLFLSRVRNEIAIPISIDIYGYNAIYRMGNWIGQDIETISKYVDVVCPMLYPSHFGSPYLADRKEGQAYAVISFGVERSKEISFQDTLIRPFLQAFSWRVKNFNAAYISNQLAGNESSEGDGYTFWHPSSKYKDLHTFLNE